MGKIKNYLKRIISVITILVFTPLSAFATANTHSVDFEADSSQYASIAGGSQTGLNFTGDFTIEAWFKPESLALNHYLAARDSDTGGTGRAWNFYVNSSNKLVVEYFSNDSTVTTIVSTNAVLVDAGVWYHLAMSVDVSAKTGIAYVNGYAVATDAGVGSATSIRNVSTTFTIGTRDRPTGAPDSFADGLVDEVRIWNDIRDSAEISANWKKELVGDEANLVAYYKMNNDFVDETSNNNDLTAVNSPVFSTDVPFTGADGAPQMNWSFVYYKAEEILTV